MDSPTFLGWFPSSQRTRMTQIFPAMAIRSILDKRIRRTPHLSPSTMRGGSPGSSAVVVLRFFSDVQSVSLFRFWPGLIRQSEFCTVAGDSVNYVNKISEAISCYWAASTTTGRRRAATISITTDFPILRTRVTTAPSTKVDSNNVTITSLVPYAPSPGLSPFFRYYAGWLCDQSTSTIRI